MAEPRINTTNQLKQYIMRKLGYPAHTIEITDEQLDDAINDTIDDYLQFAYSGYNERYFPVRLIENVQEYLLPYDVYSVLGVYDNQMSMIGANMPSNLFSINQFIAADLYRPGVAKIDLVGYEMIQQLTASIDLVFAKKKTFDFNCVSKILHFHGQVNQDETVFIHVYRFLDLDSTPLTAGGNIHVEDNIYNERWVKRMCTARAMLQWGTNIGLKYQGSILPNGGNINGQGIIDRATADMEALTAELHDRYELPVDFMVG